MSTSQNLRIPRGPFDLSGELHLSDDVGDHGAPPTVVVVTPGSSVKEQIGRNYAHRLARQGVNAVAFDPAYQGQSGGQPRDLEDPYARGEDVSLVIDAISRSEAVDPGRIGVLGICAGGGYAVHTARTDHRIKAVGTVVPVNIGRAYRQANTDPTGTPGALHELAAVRFREAQTAALERNPWLLDTLEQATQAGITDRDTLEAVTYYRTPRGQNKYSTNRRLSRSDALLLGYDAFHLVSELLTQPVSVVLAGRLGNTGSYNDGMQLWESAANRHELTVVERAGHYEMYDVPDYVDHAVSKLAQFFIGTLAA